MAGPLYVAPRGEHPPARRVRGVRGDQDPARHVASRRRTRRLADHRAARGVLATAARLLGRQAWAVLVLQRGDLVATDPEPRPDRVVSRGDGSLRFECFRACHPWSRCLTRRRTAIHRTYDTRCDIIATAQRILFVSRSISRRHVDASRGASLSRSRRVVGWCRVREWLVRRAGCCGVRGRSRWM